MAHLCVYMDSTRHVVRLRSVSLAFGAVVRSADVTPAPLRGRQSAPLRPSHHGLPAHPRGAGCTAGVACNARLLAVSFCAGRGSSALPRRASSLRFARNARGEGAEVRKLHRAGPPPQDARWADAVIDGRVHWSVREAYKLHAGALAAAVRQYYCTQALVTGLLQVGRGAAVCSRTCVSPGPMRSCDGCDLFLSCVVGQRAVEHFALGLWVRARWEHTPHKGCGSAVWTERCRRSRVRRKVRLN